MAKVVVYSEFTNGKVKKGTLELLTAAKGSDCIALALGPGAKDIVGDLAKYGAKEVLVCEDEKLANYNPELFTAIVSDALKANSSEIVLASSSMLARDLFPRVAARLNTGVVSDCTELNINGSDIDIRRPMYSGKCTSKVNFENSPTKIVLMRANQMPIDDPDESASATVTELTLPAVDLKTVIKEVVKGASEKLDLTEANIIVAGGRGMKEAEGFKVLEELADVLGATVGASRAVVDAGWVPHTIQVGQTGKTVAPSLYIACGISGAIQHLAGMSGSKVIVAINKDAEAPIFQKANYGIVGDAFEVVPKLTEEFKAILQ